jgi:hypothetical protein
MVERALLRDAIRSTLLQAGSPVRTMDLVATVADHQTHYADVYRELRAMERLGEIERAGRVGPAACAELQWRLADSSSALNQEFAGVLDELETSAGAAGV